MAKIQPKNVFPTIGKYMLADGLEMVLDLEKSQGSYIYDALSKREILDFFSFFATAAIGHNHPKLVTPEFVEKLGKVAVNNVTNSDLYTVEMASFVETFGKYAIPDYLPHLFLIAGGALGVENALKAAFDWKVQKNFAKGYTREVGWKVIHFKDAFHGRTGYTLSMTNTANVVKHKWFPKFDWPRIDNPKVKFPLNEENLKVVMKAEALALNQIKTAIKQEGDDIAALIIEPIQGEGGDNHFRPEFFKALRQICDESDMFLIYDEVQTGLGLTGKMWCHQHFNGAMPDAIAFGKKTQVCGCLVGEKVDEIPTNVFKISSRINSTWGGNLVDMVRAEKILEIIQEEKLVKNAEKMGAYLLKELEKVQTEFPQIISNARGRGLMMAFDLPNAEERKELVSKLFKNGLAVLGCGEKSIRFRPHMTLNKEEADSAIEILRKTLKKFSQ
jgi:L-lysine 6-transaminase